MSKRPSETVQYAKLSEKQQLIGVYGYFKNHERGNYISSLGFIVKEKIDVWLTIYQSQ